MFPGCYTYAMLLQTSANLSMSHYVVTRQVLIAVSYEGQGQQGQPGLRGCRLLDEPESVLLEILTPLDSLINVPY